MEYASCNDTEMPHHVVVRKLNLPVEQDAQGVA